MILVLSGHTFKYETESLCKMFFSCQRFQIEYEAGDLIPGRDDFYSHEAGKDPHAVLRLCPGKGADLLQIHPGRKPGGTGEKRVRTPAGTVRARSAVPVCGLLHQVGDSHGDPAGEAHPRILGAGKIRRGNQDGSGAGLSGLSPESGAVFADRPGADPSFKVHPAEIL